MHKTIIAVIGAMLIASPALAQDHLVPEASKYTPVFEYQPGYMKLEMMVFAEAFAKEVHARVLVEPSFSREFAVGVREDNGKFSLFYYEAPEHLWDYSVLELMKKGEITSVQNGRSTSQEEIEKLQKSLPSDTSTIQLEKHEVAIDDDLANALIDDWRNLLLQTHFDPKPTLGLDGDTYHFSMRDNYQDLAGQVWSPSRDTDIGRLVTITYAIRDVCSGKAGASLAQIRSEALDLHSRLFARAGVSQ